MERLGQGPSRAAGRHCGAVGARAKPCSRAGGWAVLQPQATPTQALKPIRTAHQRTSWKRPWLAEMKKVPCGRRCAIQWCPLAVSRYLERGEAGER